MLGYNPATPFLFPMKAYKIGYYILTVLLSALMLFSAYGGLQAGPDAVTLMTHLGYPMIVMLVVLVVGSYFCMRKMNYIP